MTSGSESGRWEWLSGHGYYGKRNPLSRRVNKTMSYLEAEAKLNALEAALERAQAERDEPWLCESCRHVWPQSSIPAIPSCVICPDCGGLRGRKIDVELREAKADLTALRAELQQAREERERDTHIIAQLSTRAQQAETALTTPATEANDASS